MLSKKNILDCAKPAEYHDHVEHLPDIGRLHELLERAASMLETAPRSLASLLADEASAFGQDPANARYPRALTGALELQVSYATVAAELIRGISRELSATPPAINAAFALSRVAIEHLARLQHISTPDEDRSAWAKKTARMMLQDVPELQKANAPPLWGCREVQEFLHRLMSSDFGRNVESYGGYEAMVMKLNPDGGLRHYKLGSLLLHGNSLMVEKAVGFGPAQAISPMWREHIRTSQADSVELHAWSAGLAALDCAYRVICRFQIAVVNIWGAEVQQSKTSNLAPFKAAMDELEECAQHISEFQELVKKFNKDNSKEILNGGVADGPDLPN